MQSKKNKKYYAINQPNSSQCFIHVEMWYLWISVLFDKPLTVCCATPPLLIYCAWLRIKIQTLKQKHMGWVRIHYRTWLCLCSFVYLPSRVISPGYNSWHDAIPPPQKSFKVRRGTRPEDGEQQQQFGHKKKKSPLESGHKTNTKQWLIFFFFMRTHSTQTKEFGPEL